MSNVYQKYHLYMDESGSFEGTENRARKENCLLFAMLVPDVDYETVEQEFRALQEEFGYSGFIHAKETSRDEHFPKYLAKLIELACQKNILLAVLRYQGDIYSNLGDTLQEVFAANRYLSMAQTMFEHLFFLTPQFYNKNIDISLHPNSRVITVKKGNKESLQQIKALGYQKKEIADRQTVSSREKNNSTKYLVFTWTSEIVATTIHRMAVEYSPWHKLIGKRNFSTINTVVAKNTSNPFVHAVDHLAWLSLAATYPNKFKKISSRLSERTTFHLTYGSEQTDYREVMHLFLNNDMPGFLSLAKEKIASFTKEYYRSSLLKLIEKSLTDPTLHNLKQMETIERLADDCLRNSEGTWDFVLFLTSRLMGLIASLPSDQRMSLRAQRLLFRLYSHKLSIHNHRGEDADAVEAYEAIKKLQLGTLSISDYRDSIALENRIAVTMANIFAFDKGISTLTPYISALEQSLKPLTKSAMQPLTDPLIGKLRGSMAQCYGFLAPKKPELFSKAEELFLAAANEFTRENDRLRHNINLLHLYLDWPKPEEADTMAATIRHTPSVARFFDAPTGETAKYCQFALTTLLKHTLLTKNNGTGLIEKFPLQSLKIWFGESVNEHPFELICGYLGRMAMELKEFATAKVYFTHALKIPITKEPRKQPTLQTIRAQIYTWWALGLFAEGQLEPAQENMKAAQSIMQEIGKTVGLEPILSVQSATPSGWFAPGWTALVAVDWQISFDKKACEAFLRCFTFNYH